MKRITNPLILHPQARRDMVSTLEELFGWSHRRALRYVAMMTAPSFRFVAHSRTDTFTDFNKLARRGGEDNE